MKIIMALAGLDIGGAETHVAELSKELKRRGNEVVMISGGGVYREELESFGIKNYVVPVKERNYADIIKSRKIIKKIIKDEKPDIVHAHARIPAFIIGTIHKEMRKSFAFVTSAHGTFDTSFLVKTLTCWGDKTLAVSEDIKKYLLKYYDVSEKDIFVSINGIDTGKFNPGISGEKVLNELNLKPDVKKIVHVSRLYAEGSAPAFSIIEQMDKIDKEVPGTVLIIAGDGEMYPKVKAEADKVNNRLKRRAVILLGARVDVNEILAAADVCVGVSRAVLEPMAMGKKCVIAGQEGYIGILDAESVETARACNFTCRGCAPLDSVRLSDDIIELLKMDEEASSKISEYGRSIVERYYSIKTMADDNVRMYRSALNDLHHNTVMLGYYGYGNRGDDALLMAILNDLGEISDEFSPVVLSYNPEKTSEAYGVASINRFNIHKIKKAMKNSDTFIAGGGSLIQDVTSTKSILYYLYILKLAKIMGLKVMLYANGIGPVNKISNRKKAAEVLDSVDVITLRDEKSRSLLKELNVTHPKIYVTADPVLSLDKYDTQGAEKILAENNVDKKFICVSVRNLTSGQEDFVEGFAKMLDFVCEKYDCIPVFLPMQYGKDRQISKEIISRMNSQGIFVDKTLTVGEIMGIISLSYAVIAVRLHMLIFGTAAGKPVLGVNYDPKVRSFQESAGLCYCLEPQDIINGTYINTVDEFMKNREDIIQKTYEILRGMKLSAKENAKIALELIEKNK